MYEPDQFTSVWFPTILTFDVTDWSNSKAFVGGLQPETRQYDAVRMPTPECSGLSLCQSKRCDTPYQTTTRHGTTITMLFEHDRRSRLPGQLQKLQCNLEVGRIAKILKFQLPIRTQELHQESGSGSTGTDLVPLPLFLLDVDEVLTWHTCALEQTIDMLFLAHVCTLVRLSVSHNDV